MLATKILVPRMENKNSKICNWSLPSYLVASEKHPSWHFDPVSIMAGYGKFSLALLYVHLKKEKYRTFLLDS
jgi:hypothetical protein